MNRKSVRYSRRFEIDIDTAVKVGPVFSIDQPLIIVRAFQASPPLASVLPDGGGLTLRVRGVGVLFRPGGVALRLELGLARETPRRLRGLAV